MAEPPNGNLEIEVKIRVHDLAAFSAQLPGLGFTLRTPETFERNVLLDTPDGSLRQRRQLLRIRRYGEKWVLTHKATAKMDSATRHKQRVEIETQINDGEALAAIFRELGYAPVFIYEKYRAEYTDGHGHIVLDRTPIGNFVELEGSPEWIDATAAKLGIPHDAYVTTSYGQVFREWKAATGSTAQNMTFAEISG
jgi:adenylate cyclase class 2